MAADTDPPVEPGSTRGGATPAPADPDRSFTTHPTGQALAKDLRDVRSKPERAFNVGAALGLTLAVATFIFLIQNNGATDFEWLWFDFELPLWTALVGALVIGAVLVLTALAVHRRRKKRIGRRERAAGRLEEALVGGEPGAAGSVSEPDRRGGDAPPVAGPDAAAPPAAPDRPVPPRTAGAEPPVSRPTGPGQVRGPMQG
jgi:uncharacterized integral membrane protein